MEKKCIDCEVVKPVEEFPSNGGGYYKARCKPCFNYHQAQYRNKPENKERMRESWKKASTKYYTTEKRRNKTLRGYGLTESDYNRMFDEQEGKCKICKASIMLVVDHCHESKLIRGLLCNMCNVGLGCFGDDVGRMEDAIAYLKTAMQA